LSSDLDRGSPVNSAAMISINKLTFSLFEHNLPRPVQTVQDDSYLNVLPIQR